MALFGDAKQAVAVLEPGELASAASQASVGEPLTPMSLKPQCGWVEYFAMADAHRVRSKEWLTPLITALEANGFEMPEDLEGCPNLDFLQGKVSHAVFAFANRSLAKLGALAANPGSPAVMSFAAMRDVMVQKPLEDAPPPRTDVQAALRGISLEGLSPDLWPASKVVDAIALDSKNQRKKLVRAPFSYIDLHRAKPDWALEQAATPTCPDDVDSVAKGSISASQFSASLQRLLLAHVACGQMPMIAAMAHIENCYQVGHEARLRGKGLKVMFMYDELCRRRWAELAYSNVSTFDIAVECSKLNKDIVDRADMASAAAAPKWQKPENRWPKRDWAKNQESSWHHSKGKGDSEQAKKKQKY
jgi:hypothetical protein